MLGKSNWIQNLLISIFLPRQVNYLVKIFVVLFALQLLVSCNLYEVPDKHIEFIEATEASPNLEKQTHRLSHFTKVEICDQPEFAIVGQPHYMVNFSPVDRIKLSTYCFEQGGGITAQINGAYAGIIGERPVWHRFELYVNGERISKETFAVHAAYGDLFSHDDAGNEIPIGTYSVRWLPELEIGPQEVELIITQAGGENLTYTWGFEITH